LLNEDFFPGKGVAEVITWKNDIQELLWEQYFDDGVIKLRCFYKNNLKEVPLPFITRPG